jgi:hemolysin D
MAKFTSHAAQQPGEMVRRVTGAWDEKPSDTARRVLPAAISFQSDLEEIIEELPPRHMRSTHYFAVLLFVTILVIAGLMPVEMVVQGTGQLISDEPNIVLQPIERAIIRELRVKPGDVVSKGELLATLDPTFAQADMASLGLQDMLLKAQLRRIEAELSGQPFTLAGDDLAPVPTTDATLTLQEDLYRQRQAQYASRLSAYDEEISRAESAIATIDGNRTFLAQQLGIARDVETMRSTLWQSRLASKIQLLEAQSLRLRAERDHQDAFDRLAELRHTAQSKRAERQAFVDDWRRQLMEDLVSKRTETARLGESLVKASRMRDLVQIIAPEDGVVLEVAKRSVGSVLREAEPLITLVPTNATLIAELMVGSADVGYTQVGNEVVVKVDAFPYQRHGLVKGRIQSVSEASFSAQSPTGETMPGHGAFHRTRVTLVATKLERLPPGARLMPGMTVTADVKVGSRSVLSYFLSPVTRGLDESLREP